MLSDAMLVRMQEWQPDLNVKVPEWLAAGVRVRHSTFGDGTVGRVGTYKDVPTVWIDFRGPSLKTTAVGWRQRWMRGAVRTSSTGANAR